MAKTGIIERLGETAVLLPNLIASALGANDRAKVRLTLLQEAAAHAGEPSDKPRSMEAELRGVGLGEAGFGQLVAGAHMLGKGRFGAPGLGALIAGLSADLQEMLAPVEAAGAVEARPFAERLAALADGSKSSADDAVETAEVARMTSARRNGRDSVHLLVMDLHRVINRLAAETAVEDIDGAKVHHVEDGDRPRIAAFMRGLNRTAPLAFGHPGLGTTAVRSGPRLTIQNDIGETDAHVLVLHVEALAVTVTYTDVHRRRAKFFMNLFEGRMDWSPLAEQAAAGLGDDEPFYLVTGRFQGADEASLDALLEFLGSRIVFLIDWNKARKALQIFVDRDAAVELLSWAAAHDVGHRAFIELGGPGLIFETVRRAAAGRIPYGVRLDAALGEAEAKGFLRRVLKETGEGLRAGRSARLIRDEIQADLAQRFETAESAVLATLVRHLGLSRTLAALLADELESPRASPAATPLAERAKRMEAKADRLTIEAREICGRLQRSDNVRRLVDEVENAMDELDECAFLLSLATHVVLDRTPLASLAGIVVQAVGHLVRATEAAARLPEGRREDAVAALQALDATTEAERVADAAVRTAIAAFMAAQAPDARSLVLALEIARALETTTDHLAHAALALRERVLEELSA